jgi:mannose-6-phosphate isomerase-like protein (cupin superfamily)
MNHRMWNVLGHYYPMSAASETSSPFETIDPPGTGVPPHVHTTQDEHIYVLEGVFTLYLDGAWETAGPGDTVRMPKNLPHAYYNKGEAPTRALFWVSPAGRLAEVLVVGYPAIVPHTGSGCWPSLPLAWQDVPYLRARAA